MGSGGSKRAPTKRAEDTRVHDNRSSKSPQKDNTLNYFETDQTHTSTPQNNTPTDSKTNHNHSLTPQNDNTPADTETDQTHTSTPQNDNTPADSETNRTHTLTSQNDNTPTDSKTNQNHSLTPQNDNTPADTETDQTNTSTSQNDNTPADSKTDHNITSTPQKNTHTDSETDPNKILHSQNKNTHTDRNQTLINADFNTFPNTDSHKNDAHTSSNNKTEDNASPEVTDTNTKASLLKSKSNQRLQRTVGKMLVKMRENLSRTASSPILSGDVNMAVPSSSKIVRIFTSSTFTDTMHERNTWMREAYPRLRSYCQSRGYEFQVVDMRWGIRDDAADDHTTFDLCMTELKLCQQLSTGPNFVSLLANKYGYRRSPPRTIHVDEFDTLLDGVDNKKVKALLTKWYLRDDNAVPPEYVLQPISKYIPNRLSDDKVLQKAAKSEWDDIECEIQGVMEASARSLLPTEKAEKYYVSITEKEIQKGMLDVPNPQPSCLWFWRKIVDIENIDPTKNETLRRYIDLSGTDEHWQESRRLLHTLEETKMTSHLPDENIHQNIVQWTDKGIDPDYAEHQKYLKTMTEDFIKEMVRLIDLGIKQRSANELSDPLMLECCEHIRFCQQKCENFCGRQASLEKIKTYIKSTSTKPLIIHGASGCGKTSLMAMAARNVRSWMSNPQPTVVLRFIGTTPDSSNISGLLLSIIGQIKAVYKQESHNPERLHDLAKELDNVLSFARPEHPLVVLLDSLDQLDISNNARSLFWLPRTLSKHVKLIVSTLEDEEYECFPKLKAMFKDDEDFLLVPELEAADAEGIIQQWLKSRNRTLTPTQLTLLNKCVYHCPLPLFLKLSFESAQSWHSYLDESGTVLQKTIRSSIDTLFSKLETSHGQIFVSRALGYLTASRNGLSESELEDILSCDDDVLNDVYQFWVPPVRRLPPLLLVRIKTEIQQYIVERGSDGIRVLYWYHRQFIEAARARYCQSNMSVNINKGLADFFSGKWADGNKKPYVNKRKQLCEDDRHVSSQPLRHGDDTYNLRRLNNAPYHRTQVDVLELKNECLLNFKFLQAKVVAFSARHVLDDFSFARKLHPKDRDLEAVRAAFEMSQGALQCDPLQLAPQLMGRLAGEKLTIDLPSQCKQCNVPFLAPDQEVLAKPGGQLVYCLTGHQGPVSSLDIKQDGKVAVSCSNEDGSVKTWDLVEGKLLKSYDGIKSNPSKVRYVCDDKYILIDFKDSYTVIQESGEVACSIDKTTFCQSQVGGKNKTLLAILRITLYSINYCDTMHVYNVATGQCAVTVDVSTESIRMRIADAFAASENYVVLTTGLSFRVYNFPEQTLSDWTQISNQGLGQGTTIAYIAIMPDETRFILSETSNYDLYIYDIKSFNRIKVITGNFLDYAKDFRITTTGHFLYYISNHEVVVWILETEQRSRVLLHTQPINDVICWGWNIMITATRDNIVRVWDLKRRKKEIKNQSAVLGKTVLAVIPTKNPRYAVVRTETDNLLVYDILEQKVVRGGKMNARPLSIKILNDQQIVIGTRSRKIKTISSDTMTVDKVFEGHYSCIFRVKSDGSEILTCTSTGRHFKIYNTTTGKTKAIIKIPSNVKTDDGRTPSVKLFHVNKGWNVLAGRIYDGPWLVFDLLTSQCIVSISRMEYDLRHNLKSALSEDGQTFAFGVTSCIKHQGSMMGKFYLTSFVIWNIRENRRIAMCEDTEYQNHYFEVDEREDDIKHVSVDKIHVLDANRLLTVHLDSIMRIWDRNTGELLNRLEAPGHDGDVGMFIKEDSPYVVPCPAHEIDDIQVWDKSTLKYTSYKLDQKVSCPRVCSDGKQFLTATQSPTARLVHWRVERVDNPTNLSSCPMLFNGTVFNPNLIIKADEDDLSDEDDVDK